MAETSKIEWTDAPDAEKLRANTDAVLTARLSRAETLHDLILDARETIRSVLDRDSPGYLRDTFDKLQAALYALRNDPFAMHMDAALNAERARADVLTKELKAERDTYQCFECDTDIISICPACFSKCDAREEA